MMKTTTCINVYSEMNDFIDFCVVLGAYENVSFAEDVLAEAYSAWFEDEEAHDVAIGDWIEQELINNGIEDFEIYWKDKEEEE